MSTLIAVYTTRAGQTSTYWATSLAWTLAENRHVMLVDCDMEGGTIADLLYLKVNDQSIGNCFGDRPARPDELEAQSLVLPNRPGLRVVPGLRGSYGYDIAECLRKMHMALTGLPDDIVIADLGHPLSHPGLRSPRSAAEAVCAVFHRAFVVIRDDPALIAYSINVLRAARPPFGELVICYQRSRAFKREILATIEREMPELPVRDIWNWEERKAAKMGDQGIPMTFSGIEKELNI